jgi:signal peptidase I
MAGRKIVHVSRTLVVVLLLASAWWLLAPTQLGGRNAYVTTHGISMEPRFHTGDLAVLRATGDVRVGEVAAYRSTALRTVVMHRIVAERDGRYTFKGDNNSWLDPEQVPRQALMGTLVLRVPQGGAWLAAAHSPLAFGLIAVLVASGTGTAGYVRHRRRHGRRRAMSRHTASVLRPERIERVRTARVLAIAGAALAVLAVIGALVAWTAPLEVRRSGSAAVAPRMTFSYRAHVRPSPAYDTTSVVSPDPVFRKVAKSVTVGYEYRGEPGTIGLTADLSAPSGWHSSVTLARPVAVRGDRSSGRARLDLAGFQRRADAAAAATGFPSSTIAIAVRATVRTRNGAFAPALKLVLTPLQLALAGDAAGLVVTGGTAPATTAVPNSLVAGGWSVPVGGARAISVAALLAALCVGGLGLRLARGATDEGAAIRRSYGRLLVPIRPSGSPTGAHVVDVEAFATLAKLAERYGLLVLHWSERGVETFVVQDEHVVYRYSTAGPAAVWPVPASGRRRAIPARSRSAGRTAGVR